MATTSPTDGGPVVVSKTQDSPLVTIERVVALLTPIFAGAAGWLFTILTKSIPNIGIPHDQFVTVFIAGATLATTASLTWLFGRQKFTHFSQASGLLTSEVSRVLHEATVEVPQLRQIEAALEAHEAAVVNGVGKAIGAPASASEVAQEIVRQLWPSQAAQAQSPTPTPPPTA